MPNPTNNPGLCPILKSLADLTVFANRMLFREEAHQCKKAFYLDHGVDYELFSTAEQDPYKPEEIENIPRPIVGFFGSIHNHTSNIDLLGKVAALLTDMSFVFVGRVAVDVSGLHDKKNVWLLGQKPYEKIPHYGKYYDVAIMPWNQNRWIEGCNPIKLKEYLALGKPIVSTPFPELENYRDVVYVAEDPEEFAECIKKALVEDNDEQIVARRTKVESASWENKAQLMLEELLSVKVSG